jgi:hypothetical protein
MEHTSVTVTLIFIHDMFRPYTAIISFPRYAELFTALLVSILKLKIKYTLKIQTQTGRPIRFSKNFFDLLV